MADTMEKAVFLDKVRSAHAEWASVLSQLNDTQFLQPGNPDSWPVKDILSHISWYEREMIKMLESRSFKGSNLWDLPTDQRNYAIHESNRDRQLKEVRDEAQKVHMSLMQWLESLSEEELNNPSRFAEMPLEWKPYAVIASNTYEHYQEHTQEVKNRFRI